MLTMFLFRSCKIDISQYSRPKFGNKHFGGTSDQAVDGVLSNWRPRASVYPLSAVQTATGASLIVHRFETRLRRQTVLGHVLKAGLAAQNEFRAASLLCTERTENIASSCICVINTGCRSGSLQHMIIYYCVYYYNSTLSRDLEPMIAKKRAK